MNIEGTHRDYGRVRIAPLLDAMQDLREADWAADPMRQSQFTVHRNTQSVRLLWTAHTGWPDVPTVVLPAYEAFAPVLAPVFRAASARLGCHLGMVTAMLARLPAGHHIPAHVDQAALFGVAHRFHVALATHPQVRFEVDGQHVPMPLGQLIEINNRRRHGVFNHSPAARVHLIFDAVELDVPA